MSQCVEILIENDSIPFVELHWFVLLPPPFLRQKECENGPNLDCLITCTVYHQGCDSNESGRFVTSVHTKFIITTRAIQQIESVIPVDQDLPVVEQ